MLKLLAKTKKLTTFLILALALNVIIPPTAQPESYPPPTEQDVLTEQNVLTEEDVLPGQDGSTNDEKEEGNTTPGNDVSPCSDDKEPPTPTLN